MTDAMTDNRSQSEEAIKRNQETEKKQMFWEGSKESNTKVIGQEAAKLLKQPSTSTRKATKVLFIEVQTVMNKLQETRPDLTANQIVRMAGSTPQQLAASKERGEAPGYLLYALKGLQAELTPVNEIHVFSFDELSKLFDCVLYKIRQHLAAKEPEKAKELQPLLDEVYKLLQSGVTPAPTSAD